MFEKLFLYLQGNSRPVETMKESKKKVTYKEVKTIMDLRTGEVFEREELKTYEIDREPDYAKIYFSDLINLKRLDKTSLMVLLYICKEMGYNNVIGITKGKKIRLSKELDISVRTFEGCILKLTKAGFLIRIFHGEYLLDPNLFARGNWREIKNLRLTIDYNPDGTTTIRSNVMSEMIKQNLRE